MHKRFSILYTLIILVGLQSCYPPEEFSNTPSIQFRSLSFIDVPSSPDPSINDADSLILEIDFQDGDGNIGLDSELDTRFPYHAYNIVYDSNDERVTFGKTNVAPPLYYEAPPWFATSQNDLISVFLSDDDIRPDFKPSCPDYEIIDFADNQGNEFTDTLFVIPNANNKNFFIDFYRKVNGQYEFIDVSSIFSENVCGGDFYGRFPIFEPDNNNRSLEGTIKYSMVSELFTIAIRADTFQVRVKIKDRELNDSNIAVSPDLTLSGILAQ